MTDDLPPLKAGESVVPLAILSTQSGAIAGATSTGLVVGRMDSSWMLIALGVLVGGAIGLLVGRGIGRVLFPAKSGQVFVVRAGKAALPLTLRASMVPAVLASVGLSVAVALALGAPLLSATVLWGLMPAIAVGLLFGFGSALV